MPQIRCSTQEETTLAGRKFILHRRNELGPVLREIRDRIPEELVTGPPFLVIHYISSVKDGTLVELGFPVKGPFQNDEIETLTLPKTRFLRMDHKGPIDGLGRAYGELFGYAGTVGLVSDEFGVEVLHDMDNPDDCSIEVRMVIHDWTGLLRENIERVLGAPEAERVFGDCAEVTEETGLDTRFALVRSAIERLDGRADDLQKYDCVSRCAHVFPPEQVAKLRASFTGAREEGLRFLEAVDRVIGFMDSDPGWSEKATREGHTIISAKGPRDRQAFEAAETPEARAAAACFCPIIRTKLGDGMPLTFCYCGAGWFRQQWEGATGLPVRVEILSSLLNGDPECRFAIHLPKQH
jgi:effector-binding domain-containing protein